MLLSLSASFTLFLLLARKIEGKEQICLWAPEQGAGLADAATVLRCEPGDIRELNPELSGTAWPLWGSTYTIPCRSSVKSPASWHETKLLILGTPEAFPTPLPDLYAPKSKTALTPLTCGFESKGYTGMSFMQSSSYVPQCRNYQSPGPWAARSIYGGLNHQKLPQAECEELEHRGLQLQDLEEREQPDVAIIDLQVHLWTMRPEMMRLLIDVHSSFRLLPRTLFLAVGILDRYCSKQTVYEQHYKLAGLSALLIASKLVDAPADALRMQDLFKLCEGDYDRSIVVEMEKRVLFILGWSVRCATVDAFLHLICAMEGDDEEVQHMATYLGILSMPHRTFVETKPSIIARSCLIVARSVHNPGIGHLGLDSPLDRWIYSLFCNASNSRSAYISQKYVGTRFLEIS
ncbi:G1 S-specific cyclin CLN1 [Fusarium mundagurra]|uniref:G1 S-specific cyclin CLN1 n=1 Tax=Fusarium mundagurra TaxID=1567541 RepID=A0A8H5XWU7_9HYPO|nr:G1 S-specific cyclin CLN1 [Fusarium mundagurra]